MPLVQMSKITFLIVALFVFAMTACDQGQSQARDDQSPPDSPASGRSDTKTLQAADLVGYNGKQLRKSVEKVLDANDQRNKQLQEDIQKTDD